MIIYNTTWLVNLRLQDDVQYEVDRGNITEAEFKAIVIKYPSHFYTPNVFIRICLFMLTCVIVSFSGGFISLIFSQTGLITGFGWFIFLGCLTYTGLELMIKSNNYFRAGVDDALLLIALVQVLIGFGVLIEHSPDYYILFAGFVLVLSIYLTLRCADMLMSAIACASFLALIFFSWIKFIPSGLSTAPFIMMGISGGMYRLACKYHQQKEFVNYDNCLVVMQVVSLIALYAAGNYYVIQNLSTQMMHTIGAVPFGWIFWAWTILLPFTYIGYGIRKKDIILLRIGMLLVAVAVSTFRAYYYVLPVDVALTIAGALILAVVYGVIQYLKVPKYGFTIAEPDKLNLMDHLKVESLIVAETFAHTASAPAPATEGVKYGGGSFGGGGSSGDF